MPVVSSCLALGSRSLDIQSLCVTICLTIPSTIGHIETSLHSTCQAAFHILCVLHVIQKRTRASSNASGSVCVCVCVYVQGFRGLYGRMQHILIETVESNRHVESCRLGIATLEHFLVYNIYRSHVRILLNPLHKAIIPGWRQMKRALS